MAQYTHANDETRHPPDAAIAMLTADHRQVRVLFQQYVDTPDPYLKQIIAEHIFAELTLHMLLEETVFYPAVAEQADEEGKRLVSEALLDHQEIKALIETLQEIDDDAAFETRFQTLRGQVEQHIEDEEARMFPEAAQVLASHWEEITDLLQELKEHILASWPCDIASEEDNEMTDWRDALQDAMYPVLTRLLQEGFVLPLFVTCIGRNGSMICGRYDDIEATGLDFLFEASHIEGAAFPPPIHMLIVDQRGEARHVRHNREGGRNAHDPCL